MLAVLGCAGLACVVAAGAFFNNAGIVEFAQRRGRAVELHHGTVVARPTL